MNWYHIYRHRDNKIRYVGIKKLSQRQANILRGRGYRLAPASTPQRAGQKEKV